jgi:hypothetical protein
VFSSRPRNSPASSMVSTSEPKSVQLGPRARRHPRFLTRASMRQKTATMKVLKIQEKTSATALVLLG